jgi:hypothetical protein
MATSLEVLGRIERKIVHQKSRATKINVDLMPEKSLKI